MSIQKQIGLITWFLVTAASMVAEERSTNGTCEFGAFHPLKLGTPIRGGREQFAVATVMPTYTEEARRKGLRGRVNVEVLVNRDGNVVKVCAVGDPLLARPTEEALRKWKFRRDFGFTFASTSGQHPAYAVTGLAFDFAPEFGGQGRGNAHADDASVWPCADKRSPAVDERGIQRWLSSEELMHRVVHRSELRFPMFDGGRLHGEVQLDILIDSRGEVACARLISGHPIAAASAMDAIQRWTFQPLTVQGKRVPVLGHLTVPFDIRR
jgi:TonB family protein